MKKIKMGQVGGGRDAFIGAVHRKAALMDGTIEFVAGALSSNPEKARISGEDLGLDPRRNYRNYTEMAAKESALPSGERIDFVSIVTPNHVHFPVAKLFLEKGFHVICDKPMTLTLEEAVTLKEIVGKSGKVFMLTHNYTGYPMVKQARHMIKTGLLGDIRKIVVEYPQEWLMQPIEKVGQKQAAWRTDPKKSGIGGCLGDIGSHCENLIHYMTGLSPEFVCADLTSFVDGRLLDDDVNVLLRFAGGVKGVLHASQICPGEENNLNIRVWGTTGGLEWHQERPNDLYYYRAGEPVQIFRRGNEYLCDAAIRASRLPTGHPEGFIEAFANLYQNVAQTILAVEEGRVPGDLTLDFPTVNDGVRGMAFIRTVVRSNQSTQKWTEMIETD
ncbi:Gfo/Idh/MocA family oxidoreductase [bacterium]|nr:Gfo/Idh/MocA family oxidoreductase [bacterium]